MRMRGFTLVELLVVMTIAAILIAAAVPSFQWMIARNRIADASNLLLANLQYARLEATRRGNQVSVCRSVDGATCSSVAAGAFDGNDWAAGWIVFEKAGGLNADTVEAGDRIIFVQQALVGGTRAVLHSNIPGTERVAYPPHGTAGVVGAGTFSIDYRTPLTPAIDDRNPASMTMTSAGRCVVVAPPLGTQTVRGPTAGVC